MDLENQIYIRKSCRKYSDEKIDFSKTSKEIYNQIKNKTNAPITERKNCYV